MLPGYRLLEPLGSGGFAEVWKCEVPGGLHKAIKFVYGNLDHAGDEAQARQELQSLQFVKNIRHPYILSIERVEIVNGELLIIMELADRNLHQVMEAHQAEGLPGIPRDELLCYFLEVAEALDLMNFQHGLQHLDIKPRNLFLISNHVKVADFGLVNTSSNDDAPDQAAKQGITPLYASPEVLQEKVSKYADQYSLAIAYQELLTGKLPFMGKSARQVMMMHLMSPPNLESLSVPDRPVVARALSKKPEERFNSCTEFVHALLNAQTPSTMHLSAAMFRLPMMKAKTSSGFYLPATSIQSAPQPDMRSTNAQLETVVDSSSMAKTPSRLFDSQVFELAPLPSCRFVQCVAQGVLGETWKIQSDEQTRERLAHIFPGFVSEDAKAEQRIVGSLQRLRHPSLPLPQFNRSGFGRVVQVMEQPEQTLWDHVQRAYTQGGARGVPRDELLGMLQSAAHALDELHQQYDLHHLGLNARNIVFREGRLELLHFGYIELMWMASGQAIEKLTLRFAPPELLDKGLIHPSCDQYALAMMYAEFVTGTQNRPSRAGQAPARGQANIPWEALPTTDHDILKKALHPDPSSRYTKCTDLIVALKESGVRKPAANRIQLPPVLPHATLVGSGVMPVQATPTTRQLIDALLKSDHQAVLKEHRQFHYLLKAGRMIEHRFRLQAYSGVLGLRLQEFCSECRAVAVSQDPKQFVARVPLALSFWDRCMGKESGLQVQVDLGDQGANGLCEAVCWVQPYGAETESLLACLEDKGPWMIESIRKHLQVDAEKPGDVHSPVSVPVQIYPVEENMDLRESFEAMLVDLSLEGVTWNTMYELETESVYLRLPTVPALAPFAFLIRAQDAVALQDGSISYHGTFAR